MFRHGTLRWSAAEMFQKTHNVSLFSFYQVVAKKHLISPKRNETANSEKSQGRIIVQFCISWLCRCNHRGFRVLCTSPPVVYSCSLDRLFPV